MTIMMIHALLFGMFLERSKAGMEAQWELPKSIGHDDGPQKQGR
jgi:hypothetical protein